MPAWTATRSPASPPPPSQDCQWGLETLGLVAEGVAHDFNNILATISGFAELILETGPAAKSHPEAVTEFARHILDAALTGQTTVRQLRGFAGHSDKGRELLDIHEVLRQSLAMARGAIGPAVRFQTDLLPGAAWLEGSRGMLNNVFINLFINARDAMPKGGCICVRTFMLERDLGESVLVVSVKDGGTGMSKEVQARIFDRYFTTKGAGGSGLGLPNARETIERAGGWINVESEPGRGTEFRIHLPLTQAAKTVAG